MNPVAVGGNLVTLVLVLQALQQWQAKWQKQSYGAVFALMS